MKNELYDTLLQQANRLVYASKEAPEAERGAYLKREPDEETIEWLMRERILVDGHRFTLIGHEYQEAMFLENFYRQCGLKGAQMGLTVVAILKRIHRLTKAVYPQGVMYLFPTRTDVTEFSKGRFDPLIRDNPAIVKHVENTNAANIKRIGRSTLYLRGARATATIGKTKRSSSQLKSAPVDSMVFDELDEMEEAMVDMALERMSHSEIGEEFHLSTPSIPDYGIDAEYQQSDGRVWMIKCRACGAHTCLELEFPNCLIEVGGRVIRACTKCHREIFPRDGEWVPQRPRLSKEYVGWWISQLNSPTVKPEKILHMFRHPKGGRLQEFYNSKLGQAYVEATDRLSIEEVLALCADHGIAGQDPGPTSMGVDHGKDLHVVIGKPGSDTPKLIHLNVYKDWEALDRLMKVFHVARCVVDALPETRNARAFAERHKGKVFLNYYQEHKRGGYAWNEKDLTVACNRTESLDASHLEIQDGRIVLPKNCEITREFADHLHNVAKRLEEDQETGSKRYVYVKLQNGLDHFRHAYNYECMARQFIAKGFFSGRDLS